MHHTWLSVVFLLRTPGCSSLHQVPPLSASSSAAQSYISDLNFYFKSDTPTIAGFQGYLAGQLIGQVSRSLTPFTLRSLRLMLPPFPGYFPFRWSAITYKPSQHSLLLQRVQPFLSARGTLLPCVLPGALLQLQPGPAPSLDGQQQHKWAALQC